MKNLILGIVIGILLNSLIAFASEKVIINPCTYIDNGIATTKVTTTEGTYRLFILDCGPKGGITAVRIK